MAKHEQVIPDDIPVPIVLVISVLLFHGNTQRLGSQAGKDLIKNREHFYVDVKKA
jgi:hypothetical protein